MSSKWSAQPAVTTLAASDFTLFSASGVSKTITLQNLAPTLLSANTTMAPQFARVGIGQAADATIPLAIMIPALGVTPTDGLLLNNPTTVTGIGALSQVSPAIHWNSQGWGNGGIGPTQPTDTRLYQSSVNGNATLVMDQSIAGGAFVQIVSYSTTSINYGVVLAAPVGLSTAGSIFGAATTTLKATSTLNFQTQVGSGNVIFFNALTFTSIVGTPIAIRVNPSYTSAAGAANFQTLRIDPLYNFAGAQTGTMVDLLVQPTETNLNGATHHLASFGTAAVANAILIEPGGILKLNVAGAGLQIKEGANCTMGTSTLNGTTGVVIATTKVTASSRIFLSLDATGGTPSGSIYVDSRVAGTSFTVKGLALDTSTFVWFLIEPL